jgi:hypothetical protein
MNSCVFIENNYNLNYMYLKEYLKIPNKDILSTSIIIL